MLIKLCFVLSHASVSLVHVTGLPAPLHAGVLTVSKQYRKIELT